MKSKQNQRDGRAPCCNRVLLFLTLYDTHTHTHTQHVLLNVFNISHQMHCPCFLVEWCLRSALACTLST